MRFGRGLLHRPICPERQQTGNPGYMGTGGKRSKPRRVKVECKEGDDRAPSQSMTSGLVTTGRRSRGGGSPVGLLMGLWGRGALSEHSFTPVQSDMLGTPSSDSKAQHSPNRAGTPHIPGSNKCILCGLNITSEPPTTCLRSWSQARGGDGTEGKKDG